jgi:hypothetical protein
MPDINDEQDENETWLMWGFLTRKNADGSRTGRLTGRKTQPPKKGRDLRGANPYINYRDDVNYDQEYLKRTNQHINPDGTLGYGRDNRYVGY